MSLLYKIASEWGPRAKGNYLIEITRNRDGGEAVTVLDWKDGTAEPLSAGVRTDVRTGGPLHSVNLISNNHSTMLFLIPRCLCDRSNILPI